MTLDLRNLKVQHGTHWTFALLFGVVFVGCGALYLTRPANPDQLAFDYMAWRQLAGEAPYHGFINSDWPGVIWLHALSISIFGLNLWSWRALDFLLANMAAMFIAGVLRRSVGGRAAVYYVLLYPFLYVGLSYWIPGNHDMAATHFACAALWFHQSVLLDNRRRFQWGAGIFLALAILCKPTFAILGPLLLIQAAAVGIPFGKVIAHGLNAAVATAIVLLLALGALLAQGVAFQEIWDCTILANDRTIQLEILGQHEPTIRGLLAYALMVHLQWWTALTVGGVVGSCVIARANLRTGSPLLVLWGAGLVSFLLQGRGCDYQLAPLFPPLVGLLASALANLNLCFVKYGDKWKTLARACLFALVLVSGATKLHGLYKPLFQGGYREFLAKQQDGNVSMAESMNLAKEIQSRTSASDTVFVLGHTSSLHMLSRRVHPVILFYYQILFKLPYLPMGGRWLERWALQLNERRPKLCIIQTDFEQRWLPGSDPAAGVLRQFLSAHYTRTGPFGASRAYTLYELKAGD
ncbi:MAG: glycosyltransferase family 39 protein [Polyangia bacterium]